MRLSRPQGRSIRVSSDECDLGILGSSIREGSMGLDIDINRVIQVEGI